MSKTLSQIREDFRLLIGQQGISDFTESEANGLANESIEYTATKCEYPRDIVEVQGEAGVPVYNLPSDFLSLRWAKYGNSSLSGDTVDLKIMDDKMIGEYRKGWLESTTANQGRPDILVTLNRKQILLSPSPDAANAVTGKKLYMGYIYIPASLTTDTSIPDLPVPFHSLLKFRMAELAYYGKLQNPKMAAEMASVFNSELTKILAASTREVDQQGFKWENVPEINEDNYGRGVVVTP